MVRLGTSLEIRGLEYDEDKRACVEKWAPDKGDWGKPQWIGWETLHKEYRRYLIHWGACDFLATRICEKYNEPYNPFNPHLRNWLEQCLGIRHIYLASPESLRRANRQLNHEGVAASDAVNHYLQFDWESGGAWSGFSVGVLEPGASYLFPEVEEPPQPPQQPRRGSLDVWGLRYVDH